MENRKPIPLGLENFKKVKERCYYVDKTPLIRQIVNEPAGTAILFTRPRRFGKSLALSMLRYFFEIEDGKEASLFSDTSIYGDKEVFSSYFGAFPVVDLNLKDALGRNAEDLLSKTAECLRSEYRRHKYLLESESLDEDDKRYFRSICSGSADKNALSSSLAALTRFLYAHYGKEVVLLIDEYDTPLRYAYENGYYREVIDFYKSLFGEALKANDDLQYAILTGILQVSKESIFSGLNNLSVNTVLDEAMDEGFGFTEKEVDELLSHYGLSSKKAEFRRWYDGYLFGKTKIYNPLSVLSAVKKGGKMEPYWSNTSEKGALYGLLTKNSFDISLLSEIMVNKEVFCDVDLAISYLDLDAPGHLPSYLLSTGYLTVEKEISYDSYLLRIPNKEIEEVFEKEIVGRYLPKERSGLAEQMKEAFLKGEEEKMTALFEKEILNGLSYYDFGSEKAYQVMVLCALSFALKDYRVKTEVNAGYGRSDIVAFPKKDGDPGMIIEVKVSKGRVSSSRLKSSSLFALSQIEEKDYVALFRDSGVKKLRLYGLGFAGKNVSVSGKEILL